MIDLLTGAGRGERAVAGYHYRGGQTWPIRRTNEGGRMLTLTQEQKGYFDANGFLRLEQVFSPAEVVFCNLKTGRAFAFGRVKTEVLYQSFFGEA